MAITLRGTGIQSSSASSYTVSWPSGTAAGDLAVIFVGGGFAATLPSGWLLLSSLAGSNWNGMTFWKVLTSGDISTGNVTVSMGGTFDTTIAIATFVGGTYVPMVRVAHDRQTSSALSAGPYDNYTPSTNDYMLYFGSNRCGGSGGTASVNIGTNLQQQHSNFGCGCLFGGNPAGTHTQPTYSFTANGGSNPAYYVIGINICDTATVPSWTQGGQIASYSTNSHVQYLPPTAVAGDGALLMVAGAWNITNPSGWTQLDLNNGGIWKGLCTYKVLNSTDISNRTVTVSFAGSFDMVASMVVVKASALATLGTPTATASANSSGASSRTVSYTSVSTNDVCFYFGTERGNFNNVTCSLGTLNFQTYDGSASSGCVYSQHPASVGTISPQFNYSGSAGDYQAVVRFGATTSTETGTVGLGFSGMSFSAAGTDSHSTTGRLGFAGISFSASGTVQNLGSAVMAFRGISIVAGGGNLGSPSTGLYQFWTL